MIDQTSKLISLISSSLNIHLNLNQTITINTSSVYYSLEKTRIPYLSNPSVLIQSMIEPLALFQVLSYTNLSRSISLSILDEYGKDISINNRIQLIIPRDPNLLISKLFLQNVTNQKFFFNFHLVYLKQNFSIHFEFQRLNKNLSYLIIYKFDSPPQLTSAINDIDDWDLFCSEKKNEDIFTYFIDNNQTANHQFIIFGIRELSEREIEVFCGNDTLNPPMIDESRYFTSNYEIRSYLSTCYFLDSNNNWNSDGLLVRTLF
jgi:hypothetical protein